MISIVRILFPSATLGVCRVCRQTVPVTEPAHLRRHARSILSRRWHLLVPVCSILILCWCASTYFRNWRTHDSVIHHLGDVIGLNRAPNFIGHFEVFFGITHEIPPLHRLNIRRTVRVEQFPANVARCCGGILFVEHVVREYLKQAPRVQHSGVATRTTMLSDVVFT